MQTEKVGSSQALGTATRVLDVEDGVPTIEMSFQGRATLAGVEGDMMGTYWGKPRADGRVDGEGRGTFRGPDGAMLTWTAHALGDPNKSTGGLHWRATLFFQPSEGKLANLSEVPMLGEFAVQANGDFKAAFFAWR